MNAGIEKALAVIMLRFPTGTSAEGELRSLVSKAESVSCKNLEEKLTEFKGGDLGALCAELRFANVIASLVTTPPEFHTSNAADISFATDAGICLLEVVRKSAPSPLSTAFHSEPALLASYANETNWKGAAHRLDVALQSLPIAIQPWVAGELMKNQIGRTARDKQEAACGLLADWLAAELPGAVANGVTRLDYPGGTAHFDLTSLGATPGYIQGSAGLNAWLGDDGTFRGSIEDKARKATERLQSTGACCYLIGLDIEDAFASTGHDIVSTVLGPLFSRKGSAGSYSYRPVLPENLSTVEEAERRGRSDLLQLAHFSRTENNSHGKDAGLYLKPGFADVTAIISLYSTNMVQVVPNPFSKTDIEPIRRLFPATLDPILLDDLRTFTVARSR